VKGESTKKIVLPVSNGFEILNVADISYLKAEGSYTRIFFADDTSVLASKNLKHFQFLLEDNRIFFRVHRSIIVNIHFARKVVRNDGAALILEDKTELPVANDKVDELLSCLRNI
jgi:two-component system LytT family response regulator